MELTERVYAIVGEQLGVEKETLVPEANLLDDLGADSLDVVELVMALEEAFDIEIPDDEAEKITKVKEAVAYIEAHAKAKK
jgi:acyl carrier protein